MRKNYRISCCNSENTLFCFTFRSVASVVVSLIPVRVAAPAVGSASPADTGRRHPPSHVMDGLVGYIGDGGGGGRRSPAVATEVRVSHHGTVAAAVAVAEASVAPAALLRGGSSTRIAASVAVAAAIAAAAVVLSEHGHGAVDAPVTAAGAVVAAPGSCSCARSGYLF